MMEWYEHLMGVLSMFSCLFIFIIEIYIIFEMISNEEKKNTNDHEGLELVSSIYK